MSRDDGNRKGESISARSSPVEMGELCGGYYIAQHRRRQHFSIVHLAIAPDGISPSPDK
jgi:hypothetical protein